MPGYRKLQKIITQRRLSLPSKHSELPPHQPVIGKPKGGKLAARGLNSASSGPQKHSGNSSNLKFTPTSQS